MSEERQIEQLLRAMLEGLANQPEKIIIRSICHSELGLVLYEAQVAKSDVGTVIGRAGRNKLAIQTILQSAADRLHYVNGGEDRNQLRYQLEITDGQLASTYIGNPGERA